MSESRSITDTTLQYARIQVRVRPNDMAEPRIYVLRADGSPMGIIRTPHDHTQWNAAALEALRRLEAGEVGLSWNTTEFGEFTDEAAPPAMRAFLDARNPLAIYRGLHPLPAPTLTQTEQRRQSVEAWARANTAPRTVAEAMVSPKLAPTPDALASRKRHVGQMWWAYVTHIVAAAQQDTWLGDTNVWPAIERALEITASDFIGGASAANWNEPAAYMEAYSRIYRADATHLSVAPTWIQGEDLIAPVYPRLVAGADRARAIVYGGDD